MEPESNPLLIVDFPLGSSNFGNTQELLVLPYNLTCIVTGEIHPSHCSSCILIPPKNLLLQNSLPTCKRTLCRSFKILFLIHQPSSHSLCSTQLLFFVHMNFNFGTKTTQYQMKCKKKVDLVNVIQPY